MAMAFSACTKVGTASCTRRLLLRIVNEKCLFRDSLRSLFENPYTKFFRVKPSEDFPKQTTGLTGLNVSEHPHRELSIVYARILRALEDIPETAAYRKYTEQIVKQRLHHVQTEPDVLKLEEKIGMGQVEELLQQAEFELTCARQMLKYRVWEPLVEHPNEDQWKWPI